jgi:hypothetical protein
MLPVGKIHLVMVADVFEQALDAVAGIGYRFVV